MSKEKEPKQDAVQAEKAETKTPKSIELVELNIGAGFAVYKLIGSDEKTLKVKLNGIEKEVEVNGGFFSISFKDTYTIEL